MSVTATTGSECTSDAPALAMRVGIVVIGRNEGARLRACLASLPGDLPVVYVDSGSTDGSPGTAEAVGAEVVALDMRVPFSAARARNEGFARLLAVAPTVEAVQFLDGDTALRSGWLHAATAFVASEPEVVAVAGRRRERYPDASVYNAFCDDEWDTPVGEARATGGDFLVRADAFDAVGGFRPDVIAGEEPELCLRMRERGGRVVRLAEEMTWHDADIQAFAAFWRRAQRAGYAYALGALMHGKKGYNLRETARVLVWGAGLPVLAVLLLSVGWWPGSLVVSSLYLAKFVRLRGEFAARTSKPGRFAGLTLLSNIAEVSGILRCLVDTIGGRRKIVEYK